MKGRLYITANDAAHRAHIAALLEVGGIHWQLTLWQAFGSQRIEVRFVPQDAFSEILGSIAVPAQRRSFTTAELRAHVFDPVAWSPDGPRVARVLDEHGAMFDWLREQLATLAPLPDPQFFYEVPDVEAVGARRNPTARRRRRRR